MLIKFCTQCGGPVALKIPAGDTVERAVCTRCAHIHYENPKVIAGCIVYHEDKVLLCRRAIEPQRGLWTIPAGFMENGESVAAAAARETKEEACADVEIEQIFYLSSIIHINQVYVVYVGRLKNQQFEAGTESLEVALFSLEDIPWSELAFDSVRESLKRYSDDRKSGRLGFHTFDVNNTRPANPLQ